jgi:hypothetical protein
MSIRYCTGKQHTKLALLNPDCKQFDKNTSKGIVKMSLFTNREARSLDIIQ